ncbi:DNA polymerase I family protein, partial [Thermoplasmatales archaeon SCGC AB-539-N05]
YNLRLVLIGRYMAAVASMEYFGVPIDIKNLEKLKNCWDILKEELIRRVDKKYHVYEGTTFKISLFKKYLEKYQIPWDYTPTDLPRTDNSYMKMQAKTHPQLKALQELRYSLGQLKLNNLQVGKDGRNRCLLSPFRSKTSRNQPSSSKFIFGNATWIRHLIKPRKGQALAYIDFEQQEIAIAAALSGDEHLRQAYNSGDPYVAFAKAAGAIPPNGTKKTHPEIRENYKMCMLALNYGMSVESFANKAKITLSEAKLMVKLHRQKYSQYWKWNSDFIDTGMLSGIVKTKFNWFYQTAHAKYRTLMNWPMQSHGADILRLAISMCVDNGIQVAAPVHDAILIEAPIDKIEVEVKKAQRYMELASEFVLNFKINTDVKIIRYPETYTDPRGAIMWNHVWDIIHGINPAGKKARLLEKEEAYG